MSLWQRFAYRVRVSRELSGRFPRECPICGFKGMFLGVGHPPRYDAQCPRCRSNERHRFLKLVIDRNELVKDTDDVLHFAPEAALVPELKRAARNYVTADLKPGRADRVLDIEALDLADESYGVVVCNHVLEHVDDRRALAELYRVLRPGGRLISTFPIIEGWDKTYEDETVTGEHERVMYFGQYDHRRIYGRDVRARIDEAGFELKEHTSGEPDVMRYGLQRGKKVFVGVKKAPAG